MSKLLIDVQNLSIKFQTKRGLLEAVRGISFQLSPGETLGVVGESGCGKSITNLALMGLLPDTAVVTADKLNFAGTDLLSIKEKQWQGIRGDKISMIFQDPMSALNPCFTVGYQLDETLRLHTKLDKVERKERCIELLAQVGIPAPESRLTNYAHELSGGMAQRVMIAMAIACGPELLIADEPTTALDVTVQNQILRLLRELQEEYNMAMILVTHDLGVVAQNADRIQVMYAGEIVESAASEEIIHHSKHPYTNGLLASLPSTHQGEFKTHLSCIPGLVPNLFSRPAGCQFNPRCEFATDECREQTPALQQVSEGYLRCFNPVSGARQ